MITVVFVKNPFEPQKNREVHTLPYVRGKNVDYYVQQCTKELTLPNMVISRNSYTINGAQPVKDNDFIVFAPVVGKGHGKNPLLIIATVALSVVAMGVGGWVASGFTSYGAAGLAGATGFAAIGGYLAAAAVMFVGGTLIQRAFGTANVSGYKSSSENPTYSWSGIQTTTGQDNPIPITYGTVRSGGQTIGKYITSDSDKQYLNWLVSAGYGPLRIYDVQLNDNPIENYKDVKLDTRSGTNDQDIIPTFNDTISTKTLGYELLDDAWRTDLVTGTATQGLIIYVECSNGLYYANDKGGLDETFVEIKAQYAPEGSSDWKDFLSPHYYLESKTKYLTLNDDAAPIGEYDIKFKKSGDSCTITVGQYSTTYVTKPERTIAVGPFNWVTTHEFSAWEAIFQGKAYVRATKESADNGMIKGNKSSAIRRQYRVDNLPAGQYQVRIKVTSRGYPVTSTRAATRIWWTGVSGIVYDDFTYPNIALIGIRAMATDQLSSSPTLKFMKQRSTVYVWNPGIGTYEEHDATNPAWAAYDMVHRANKIVDARNGNTVYVHSGADASLMLYNQFAEWAAYCDQFKLKINIEINTSGEMLDVVNRYIAPVGRGIVELFGTKYGCCWDGPKEAVQMFGMGNIITGTFSETFLQTSDRANAVELTFTNSQKDYERDTVKVFGPTFDTDEYDTTSQLTYDGITGYEQAYREAKFQLYCNAYMVRTVSFQAAIDAIACTVGDVIYVAHDVPMWQTSGRIAAVDANTVTVNAVMRSYDSSKSYTFAYRSSANDTRYEIGCSSITVGDSTTTVVLSSVPESAPAVGDIFDIAEVSKGTKKFVVRSISRTEDMVREIEAIEYSEDVFNENYTIPPMNYSDADDENDVRNVTNLTGRQINWKDSSGQRHARLYLSWSYPERMSYQRFTIFLSSDNSSYVTAGSSINMYFETEVNFDTTYLVKVVTVNHLRNSTGTTIKVEPGTDEPPADVKALSVEKMSSGLRRYWWEFTYPDPDDIAGFRMKYTQGTTLNWENGIPVQDGLITSQPYETQTVRQGVHAVMIKAVDNAGNESVNFAYCLLDMGDLLEQNVLYYKDYAANNWVETTHNGYLETDGYLYPVNNTDMWESAASYRWDNADAAAWSNNWQPYTVTAEFTAPVSGQMWLKYDIDGPAIVYYREVLDTAAWNSDDAPAWISADTPAWELDEVKLWKQYSDRINITAGDEIQIQIVALDNNNEKTVVKGLSVYIDVPDRNEHFEDLTIPATGLELPIVTPHYHTTAVHIDSVQGGSSTTILQPVIVSRNPCVVKLINQSGEAVAGTVDISWQGYVEEVL